MRKIFTAECAKSAEVMPDRGEMYHQPEPPLNCGGLHEPETQAGMMSLSYPGWMIRIIPVPPRGTCEASPPFQRREGEATNRVPGKGTTELALAQENLNGLNAHLHNKQLTEFLERARL